jgi:hypothetical protein
MNEPALILHAKRAHRPSTPSAEVSEQRNEHDRKHNLDHRRRREFIHVQQLGDVIDNNDLDEFCRINQLYERRRFDGTWLE